MSKEQFQDKYNEIFQEMKDEKLNWDFDDFLKKTQEQESETPIIPIGTKKTPRIPKIFWMAASIVLLAGIFFGIKNLNSGVNIKDQEALVQQQLKHQKSTIIRDNNMAYQNPQDSIKVDNNVIVDSLANEVSNPDKVMSQIAPKKGRLAKMNKERYAYEDKDYAPQKNKKSPEYEDNFVIVNGHKIRSEEEAINVTKYSFQILSENVAKTLASTVVQENPIND